MSAQQPTTFTEAFMHAEKLMNDGFTFEQIKSLLTAKATKIADGIKQRETEIANLESERQALRDVYKHILGIERNARESISAQPIISNKPAAAHEYVPAIPAVMTPAEVIENAPEIVVPVAANSTRIGIPEGIYTVVMANERRTIKIKKHWDATEAAKGTQVAYYLSGSNNESDYTGCAFIDRNRVIMWKRFRSGAATLTTAINYLVQADNYLEAGMAYAVESGNCWHCGRTLTVPASVARGLGPICSEKLGVA